MQRRKEIQKHITGTVRDLAQHLVTPDPESLSADLKVHRFSCDQQKFSLVEAKDSSSESTEYEAFVGLSSA